MADHVPLLERLKRRLRDDNGKTETGRTYAVNVVRTVSEPSSSRTRRSFANLGPRRDAIPIRELHVAGIQLLSISIQCKTLQSNILD